MKDENLENSVITLHAKGWPIRKISKETWYLSRASPPVAGIKLGTT